MADSSSAKAVAELPYVLVVRHAFLDYQVGEKITDAGKISEILSGDMAVYVIKAAKAD
ncbi:TPA: hypothetical protein ACQ431_003007 [Citrobacter murliniae]